MLSQLRKDTYSINSATTVSQTQKTNYEVATMRGWGAVVEYCCFQMLHTSTCTHIQHNDDNFCLNLILFAMQFGTHSFHFISFHQQQFLIFVLLFLFEYFVMFSFSLCSSHANFILRIEMCVYGIHGSNYESWNNKT